MSDLAAKLKKLKKAHNTLVEVVESLEQTVDNLDGKITKLEVLLERVSKKVDSASKVEAMLEETKHQIKEASEFVRKEAKKAVFLEVSNQPLKMARKEAQREARIALRDFMRQSVRYSTELIDSDKFRTSDFDKMAEKGYRCIGISGPPIFKKDVVIFEKSIVKLGKEQKKKEKIKREPA